jgi:hypothetical protein
VPGAELRHEKTVIEDATIVAVATKHFEGRTVPDEVINRLHPPTAVPFCSQSQAAILPRIPERDRGVDELRPIGGRPAHGCGITQQEIALIGT